MSTAEFHDDDLSDEDEEDEDAVDLDELPDRDDTVSPGSDDTPAARGTDDDDDEDEEDEVDDEADDTADDDAGEGDDEAEESLDVLLAREKVLDEDDLGRIAKESRDGLNARPALIGADEFTCRSCFLVKRRAQLADEKRLLCFDCV